MLRVGGGQGSWKFDAEFKFAKIQNSHVQGGWVGGGGGGFHGNQFIKVNFKFSKSSPELKFLFSGWGGSEGLMEFMEFGAAT